MSAPPRFIDSRNRFESWVERGAGCWLWRGGRQKRANGSLSYGIFCVGKKRHLAHRFAVALDGREARPDQVVLHTCDNPACVNPAHLVVGTQAENLADMRRKGRGFINRFKSGTGHPNAKLTPALVSALRADRDAGLTFKALGLKYGIEPTTAHNIVQRRTWREAA